MDDGRHISCTMTSVLIGLVRRERGEAAVRALLAEAGTERHQLFLEDRDNWVSLDEAMRLLSAGARVTEDPDFARRVGSEAVRQHAGSQVATLLRSLGSPEAVLGAIATTTAKFSTVTDLEALNTEPGHALVRARAREGFGREQLHCDWAAGLLSTAPELFGLPPARVHEIECQARGGKECMYEITWNAEQAAAHADPEQRVRAVEAQLAGLTTRLETVYATATDLVSTEDLDVVLDRIVERAAGEVRATGHALAVRKRPEDDLVVFSHGVDEERALANAREPEGDWVLVADVASSQRDYGKLIAVYPEGMDFFDQERRLLQLYAKHAAAVLDMAMAFHDAASRHAQVSALLSLSNALVHAGTSVEVAERMTEAVPEVVDCDRVGVWIWDAKAERLRHVAATQAGDVDDAWLDDVSIGVDDSPALAGMVAEPEPVFLQAATTDPFLAEIMSGLELVGLIAVPIVSRDEFLGVLTVSVVERPERLKSGPELLERLTGIAALAATALRAGRLVDELDHRARHDALTGLLDRAGFAEAMTAAFDACGNAGRPVGLLFVDLDGFKRVNDAHGHDVGDELLRHAAGRLVHLFRRQDEVARLGGDEFAVILDEISCEADVEAAARRVRAAFAHPFSLGSTQVRVTASVGHAIWPDGGRTIDALVREADAAMYREKTTTS